MSFSSKSKTLLLKSDNYQKVTFFTKKSSSGHLDFSSNKTAEKLPRWSKKLFARFSRKKHPILYLFFQKLLKKFFWRRVMLLLITHPTNFWNFCPKLSEVWKKVLSESYNIFRFYLFSKNIFPESVFWTRRKFFGHPCGNFFARSSKFGPQTLKIFFFTEKSSPQSCILTGLPTFFDKFQKKNCLQSKNNYKGSFFPNTVVWIRIFFRTRTMHSWKQCVISSAKVRQIFSCRPKKLMD